MVNILGFKQPLRIFFRSKNWATLEKPIKAVINASDLVELGSVLLSLNCRQPLCLLILASEVAAFQTGAVIPVYVSELVQGFGVAGTVRMTGEILILMVIFLFSPQRAVIMDIIEHHITKCSRA